MARTHEQFIKELNIINPNIEVLGHYTRVDERLEVKCRVCGKEWTPLPYSLLSGKGCPHCSALRGAEVNKGRTGKKGLDRFLMEMYAIDSSIEIVGEYINNKTPIKCHCTRCNTDWMARPDSLLRGHGCPRCAKSGTSFMEQFILHSFRHVLGEEEVLSRNKTEIGLELDIFIPKKKLAIEPGNWYLHKRSLKRDALKRKRCADNGIRLITVYDNFPEELKPPFDNDCITFSGDYNADDHSNIRQLIVCLFEIGEIKESISEEDYELIAKSAYNDSLSRTHEQFVHELSVIAPDIEILGTYVNANRRLKVRCNKCGFEWNAIPANLLAGDGCRKCGAKKAHEKFLKTQDEFVTQMKEINPTIEIIGQYKGRHAPVKARCLLCGYEWSPQASSLLRGSTHKGAKGIHVTLLSKEKPNEKNNH